MEPDYLHREEQSMDDVSYPMVGHGCITQTERLISSAFHHTLRPSFYSKLLFSMLTLQGSSRYGGSSSSTSSGIKIFPHQIHKYEAFSSRPEMIIDTPSYLRRDFPATDISMQPKMIYNSLSFTDLTSLLQSENVMNLVVSQLPHKQNELTTKNQLLNEPKGFQLEKNVFFDNVKQKPSPFKAPELADSSLTNCSTELPTFTPKKIIDYGHVHKKTFCELLQEFQVYSKIDYKHQTSLKLQKFIENVDVDKIIKKRKSIVARRKILEYLKTAKRPEDTVSNPCYPKNWKTVESEDRKPSTNKRKKKLTNKIQQVVAKKLLIDQAEFNRIFEGKFTV